ncbi:MAG TPA: suppressor of fused domain protein, partial [Roseiflexaceae bacterium]|nr:suppressor of fused domain protein [Roseiflexaceae bacterium]
MRQPPPADQAAETLPVSPLFSILAYEQNPLYLTYCTLGASYRIIPHSEVSFGDTRGVRYEYLFHAPLEHEAAICELLLLVAEHPHHYGVEYGPGFVLPIGEPVVRGSSMEYLYFTYPFLDDQKIYEGGAYGQIERADLLIQTLWVFPIYRSEYLHLRSVGAEAFEDTLFEHHR